MTKMQQLSKHMPAWARAAAPEGTMEDTFTPQTLLLRESAGARYLPGMDTGMTCEASGASMCPLRVRCCAPHTSVRIM